MDLLWTLQFGFAPALALALVHSLWQGALIAILAWGVLAACANRSAALRHALGMGFLLAMTVVPMLSFVGFWLQPALDVNAGILPAMTPTLPAASSGRFEMQSNVLAALLAVAWLLGVAAMLLWHVGGLRVISALDRKACETLPPDWQRRVARLQQALGISRTVGVRLADDIAAPFTARLFRPVIWLPLSLLTRLPVDQVEALIAHELAHIRRLDWVWNGLQCLLESLLFYHPGAWWLGRRIRQEREHACDDLAVVACGDAIALAEALTALERHRHPSLRLVLASDGGSLMQRITRLLTGANPGSRWRLPVGILVVLASGALLATQVDFSRYSFPDLEISATTDGKLGPGDERIIRANGVDGTRYYRIAIDRQGKTTEEYQKDGRTAPITADVRAWIAETSRIGVPPLPPLPPMPPPPPPPPAPPEITESRSFQDILRLVAADARVTAKLGTPITVVPGSVDGNLHLYGRNDSEGDADLTFVLSGPKGRATTAMEATRTQGAWTVASLELR